MVEGVLTGEGLLQQRKSAPSTNWCTRRTRTYDFLQRWGNRPQTRQSRTPTATARDLDTSLPARPCSHFHCVESSPQLAQHQEPHVTRCMRLNQPSGPRPCLSGRSEEVHQSDCRDRAWSDQIPSRDPLLPREAPRRARSGLADVARSVGGLSALLVGPSSEQARLT